MESQCHFCQTIDKHRCKDMDQAMKCASLQRKYGIVSSVFEENKVPSGDHKKPIDAVDIKYDFSASYKFTSKSGVGHFKKITQHSVEDYKIESKNGNYIIINEYEVDTLIKVLQNLKNHIRSK